MIDIEQINYFDFEQTPLSYEYLAKKILNDLNEIGYIVVKNFNIDPNNLEESREKFLKLSLLIGDTIAHDNKDSIIWDIKSNAKSDSLIKTYSEHSHEAELHTDSQYSSYPEDYFGLLTLKKAECGGGLSSLLSLKNVIKTINELENSEALIDTLSSTNYPFIVPNVFKKTTGNNDAEFNYGPILRENEIRFRVDTFEKALQHEKAECTRKQIDAYKILKKIILENKHTEAFFLEERDLIFINNKTMLHGRNEFTDQNRHLLRIRMNKFDK